MIKPILEWHFKDAGGNTDVKYYSYAETPNRGRFYKGRILKLSTIRLRTSIMKKIINILSALATAIINIGAYIKKRKNAKAKKAIKQAILDGDVDRVRKLLFS